jgi:26S proteasome regulatory subunit T1
MADEKKDKKYIPLDEAEINLFKAYGLGPYAESIKKLEEENKEMVQKINKLTGIKELDTGISLPAQWNLAEDSKRATEQPLQVARCNKIINDGT